jgi:putative glutamine amidotransferase
LLAQTSTADAIILMGGEDVAPEFYEGPLDYPGSGHHHRVADAAEIELIHRALSQGIPLVGICRGLQIVNVALGGDLIQHLPTAPSHVGRSPLEAMVVHDVEVAPDSRVATLADEGTLIRSVRSGHHQAVGRLGGQLVAVAWAPDGTIEAVEHETAPLIAVQWHPEDLGAPTHHLPAIFDLLESLVGAAQLA